MYNAELQMLTWKPLTFVTIIPHQLHPPLAQSPPPNCITVPSIIACNVANKVIPPQLIFLPRASSKAAKDINGHQTTSLVTNGVQGFVILSILTKKMKSLNIM